jgi:hypothetical protein
MRNPNTVTDLEQPLDWVFFLSLDAADLDPRSKRISVGIMKGKTDKCSSKLYFLTIYLQV